MTHKYLSNRLIHLVSLTGVALLVACAGNPPVPPAPLARGDYAATKRYVAELIAYEMKKHDVTGLSIALIDDQEIVWAQGFGYADKANGVRATPDTVYRVGSISKLFTATAAMQLAQQGRLDIDQPLARFVPDFSIKSRFADTAAITPRTIMTHHSGLPGDLLHGMWTTPPAPAFGTVTAEIKDEYVASPPNVAFAYSNLGYTLLGQAVQNVAGEDFSTYLARVLLEPLGMARSAFSPRPDTPGMAKAYDGGTEAVEPALRDVPAGGLNSTVVDLGRFAQMVFADGRAHGREIVSPRTLAEMLRAQNADVPLDLGFRVGLGWMLSALGGIDIEGAGPVAHHSGGTFFYNSQLIVLPRHKLGVVVLANSKSTAPVVSRVATAALKLALEAKTGIRQPPPPPAPAAASALTPEEAQAYVGHYATALGFATVTGDGARLRVNVIGKNFDLVPRGNGRVGIRYRLLGIFPIRIEDLDRFELSRAAVAGRELLVAHYRNQTLAAGERILPPPIPQAWRERLGEYRIVNGTGDALAALTKRVQLRTQDGFLLVEIVGADGAGAQPLAAISDTEAVYTGLGRGTGGTVRIVARGTGERLLYSGYELEKTAD